MITFQFMNTEQKAGLRDRLKQARKYAGLTQAELAQRIQLLPGGEGFGQTTYQALEAGRVKSTAYIVHIAMACGVNPTWLATGLGDMAFQSPHKPWETGSGHRVTESPPPPYRTDNYNDVAIQLGYLIETLEAEGIEMEDDKKLAVAKILARLKKRERPDAAVILDLLH